MNSTKSPNRTNSKQIFVFYVNGKKYTIKAESYSVAYYVILPKISR